MHWPLSGVKVLDLGQIYNGSYAGFLLAHAGADVVKVENPNRGDPGRRLKPNHPDDDPFYFHILNANKRSMTANLKSPKGLELVRDLLREADVMVENFAPGAIERLGLGYDEVKKINPGIIYAQVKGFGEGSPFEKNLAFDMIAQACGGTFSVTGDPDGPPTRPGISLGDTGTGMLLAITVLGALYKKRETGEGHKLEVAMQDAILHYMRIPFSTMGLTQKPAERGGGKVPGIENAPMGLYACAPGGPNDYIYIMTSRANPEHWDRLLKVVVREDLIGDEKYNTPAKRLQHEPEVDKIIAAWTKTETKFDAMKIVGEAGIPAGAVMDTAELYADKTFEERGVMQTMEHPVHEPFKMPGWPVRVDGKAVRIKSSPMLGEHTEQVIGEWLGLNEAAVGELKAAGAVGS